MWLFLTKKLIVLLGLMSMHLSGFAQNSPEFSNYVRPITIVYPVRTIILSANHKSKYDRLNTDLIDCVKKAKEKYYIEFNDSTKITNDQQRKLKEQWIELRDKMESLLYENTWDTDAVLSTFYFAERLDTEEKVLSPESSYYSSVNTTSKTYLQTDSIVYHADLSAELHVQFKFTRKASQMPTDVSQRFTQKEVTLNWKLKTYTKDDHSGTFCKIELTDDINYLSDLNESSTDGDFFYMYQLDVSEMSKKLKSKLTEIGFQFE